MNRFLTVLPLLLWLLVAPPPLVAQSPAADYSPSQLELKIGGFTDFNLVATDEEGDDSEDGFKEGQFILHFNSTLGSRLSFFAELSLTARDSEFKSEVERAILSYLYSDALKVSLGRYHTPINWWNTAFHHGQWLQTTVDRPEMVKFGGIFIPVHFVGGQVEGKLGARGWNFGYTFGLGNGRSSNPTRAGDAGDVNSDRAWLVNLSLRPDRPYSLQLGAAYYSDQINLEGAEEEIRESITSAYLVWLKETPELIAEYARVHHRDELTRAEFDSEAYYVQLAYRLPWSKARFKPYLRYEDIDVEYGDPVFADFPTREGGIIGARLDFFPAPVALKLEYRRERNEGEDHVNGGYAQVSFGF